MLPVSSLITRGPTVISEELVVISVVFLKFLPMKLTFKFIPGAPASGYMYEGTVSELVDAGGAVPISISSILLSSGSILAVLKLSIHILTVSNATLLSKATPVTLFPDITPPPKSGSPSMYTS